MYCAQIVGRSTNAKSRLEHELTNAEAKKTVLIGAYGMLGRAWSALLTNEGVPFVAPSLAEVDLTRPQTLTALDGAERIICCAAYTDVDGAESNEAAADAVNAVGIAHLAQYCAQQDAMLVHYGTDYVFAGDADAPYPVDGPRAPINAYGRSKAKGEEAILASGTRHLHLRTSWLYAPWGKNFVRTMAKLTAERDSLTVVNDQVGRPTSAEHLAATSWALLTRRAEGFFHVSDGGQCSWYEFAHFIGTHLGHRCAVSPCTSDAFPRPAKRPAWSVLDLTTTEALVGPMAHWKDNVAAVLDRPETLQNDG